VIRRGVSQSLRFDAPIKIREGNPYILVSAARAKTLAANWRKPLPVLIRVNGQPRKPWRINMMPTGKGSFHLYLHGDVRRASRTQVGDRVAVEIAFDSAYKNGPMHPMPTWFKAALQGAVTARKNWQALSPSRQKEVLRYFSWLKSAEARERNLAKVLHVLSGKPGRFMARAWKDGK
jgi:hypothetical protein